MCRGRLRNNTVCRSLPRRIFGTLTSLLLVAGNAAQADEFRTPAISAVRVDWRAALDQLRSEIETRPAAASGVHVDPSLPAAHVRSALDAGAGAIERGDVSRSSPVSGAVRCRCCCRSTPRRISDARLNGAPASLSLSHYQADFRPADMFDAGPAGYDAVFSLEPGAGAACRSGPLPGRSRSRSPARC